MRKYNILGALPHRKSNENLPTSQYMNSIILMQIMFVYLIFSDFSIILTERSRAIASKFGIIFDSK